MASVMQEVRPGLVVECHNPISVEFVKFCTCGRDMAALGMYADFVHYRKDEPGMPCLGGTVKTYIKCS